MGELVADVGKLARGNCVRGQLSVAMERAVGGGGANCSVLLRSSSSR